MSGGVLSAQVGRIASEFPLVKRVWLEHAFKPYHLAEPGV
jgi:hypothetical protein